MSEPGAGSGRSEAMLWRGVSCEKGAMLVKHLQAGLCVTAWLVHVPGPASQLQGSGAVSPADELDPAALSTVQSEGSDHGWQ